MKVLLLGGTGAMGEHLVRLLANDNIETFVTSRKKRNSFGSIHYVVGDAHDDLFINNLLAEKFDVIVDFMVYTTSEFSGKVSNYLINTNQYIFLSSARVYADSEKPLTENSPRLLDICNDKKYLATDEYAISKAKQEDILFASGKYNWSIIRPYITYSEIRLQLGVLEKEDWLCRTLRGHTVVFSKDIMNKTTTMTYGLNVAQGINAIIGNVKALGHAFHITHNRSILWSNVWDIYRDVISKNIGIEPRIKLCDMHEFEKLYDDYYQIHYDRMYDRVFDNSKINQFLDTSCFLDPIQGLEKCLNEFILQKNTIKVSGYGSEGVKDLIANEYWSLNDIPGLMNKVKYIVRRFGL